VRSAQLFIRPRLKFNPKKVTKFRKYMIFADVLFWILISLTVMSVLIFFLILLFFRLNKKVATELNHLSLDHGTQKMQLADISDKIDKLDLRLDLITEKVSDINVRVMITETRLEERAHTINVPAPRTITQQKRKYVRKKMTQ
jgi:hypothetical protein